MHSRRLAVVAVYMYPVLVDTRDGNTCYRRVSLYELKLQVAP